LAIPWVRRLRPMAKRHATRGYSTRVGHFNAAGDVETI
jgi:hypothetical protein